jgi:hypothetical protein
MKSGQGSHQKSGAPYNTRRDVLMRFLEAGHPGTTTTVPPWGYGWHLVMRSRRSRFMGVSEIEDML